MKKNLRKNLFKHKQYEGIVKNRLIQKIADSFITKGKLIKILKILNNL